MIGLDDNAFTGSAACVVSVKTGGGMEELVDYYAYLLEVRVERARKPGSQAILQFESIRDMNGNWVIQDSGLFLPWTYVQIEADFGLGNRAEIMRGYIRQVKVSHPEDTAVATVEIIVQDQTLAMDRYHRRTTFGKEKEPIAESLLLTQIMETYSRIGLLLHPENDEGQQGLVLNQDSTDIQFLQNRAEANGYELYQEEDKLYFGNMRLDADSQYPLRLYAGPATNCMRLNIEDDGHKPDEVIYEVALESGDGAKAKTKQEKVQSNLTVMGDVPAESKQQDLEPFAWRMQRQDDVNPEQLKIRAQAKANQNAMKIQAEGELDGSLYRHVLNPGHPVGVDGAGDHLNGIYYVDQVTHVFNSSGYRQQFILLRNAYAGKVASADDPLANLRVP